MSQVADAVVRVGGVLRELGIGYAIGGGLALQHYANPRMTNDVDLNVAAPLSSAPQVVVDPFFSFDPYHDRIMERAVLLPFEHEGGRSTLPFLSADDLVVVKLSFNRGRDGVNIEAMIDAGTTVDPQYVERELVAWRGPPMYPRVAQLRRLLRPTS